MSIRSSTDLLDEFMRDGLAVEVTHRTKRRLFALSGLTLCVMKSPAPAATARTAPDAPARSPEEEALEPVAIPAPSLSPVARKAIDYSDLEAWMAHATMSSARPVGTSIN